MQLLSQTTTETKAVIAENPNKSSAIIEGGGLVLGGIVTATGLWAVASKLLERFGNSAIDARQKEIDQKLEQQKQDLLQQRELFDYFKGESSKDSSTLNDTLRDTSKQLHNIAQIFVTKELDNSAQYKDLYYALLERLKKLEDGEVDTNTRLAGMESVLKDILAVLRMKERQNS